MPKDQNIADEIVSTPKVEHIFCLYVTGASPNSIRAIGNAKEIFEQFLPGQYSLKIIDIHQQPAVAQKEQLIALPMLVRKFPLPERRLIGDLSNTERVLKSLGLNL